MMFRTLVDLRSFVSGTAALQAKRRSGLSAKNNTVLGKFAKRLSISGIQLSTLRLLLVFGLFSVCAASSSRYNRLDTLQRSMNVPYPADENMLDFPLNSEPKEPVYSNDVDAKYTYTANSYKRNGIRRCGMLLLKHIQSICNGCIDRPRSSEESGRKKRGADPFSDSQLSLTDLCCKKSCKDEELMAFCCSP